MIVCVCMCGVNFCNLKNSDKESFPEADVQKPVYFFVSVTKKGLSIVFIKNI